MLCSQQPITANSFGPSFECLAAYSKEKGFNEPEFDAVAYDSHKAECVAAIATFAGKVRSDIVEKMSEVSSDEDKTACINRKFTDDETFVNNIIRGEALAAVDDKAKSDKLRDVEKFAEDFITEAITKCFESR